ncbi:MAG: hypothetical protein ACXVZW_02690 [Gaiellaceae bacterium]
MRVPRLALSAATAVGAVALTALAVGGPAGARPAAGGCKPPQQAALVSPDGLVEPASAGSHLLPGWRVLCWPPRFYTGTVVTTKSSKWSQDYTYPSYGGKPAVSTKRSDEDVALTYNVVYELTAAGVDASGGHARYTLGDGFVSAHLDGHSHDYSKEPDPAGAVVKDCSWTSRGSTLLHGDLTVTGTSGFGATTEYRANATGSPQIKVPLSCEFSNGNGTTHNDSVDPLTPSFATEGKFERLSFFAAMKGDWSHKLSPPPPLQGAKETFRGSESSSWDLVGFLESTQLPSKAGKVPAQLAYLLVAHVDENGEPTLTSKGKRIARLSVGRTAIVVMDESAEHNLHLKGPGVSKATGKAQVGVVTWIVSLKKGAYSFFCDGHPAAEKGRFTVA